MTPNSHIHTYIHTHTYIHMHAHTLAFSTLVTWGHTFCKYFSLYLGNRVAKELSSVRGWDISPSLNLSTCQWSIASLSHAIRQNRNSIKYLHHPLPSSNPRPQAYMHTYIHIHCIRTTTTPLGYFNTLVSYSVLYMSSVKPVLVYWTSASLLDRC